MSKNRWRKAKSFDRPDSERVDLWLYIYASPRSMGMADAFKVPDAWQRDGRWYHTHEGKEAELFGAYVTHWSPRPSPEAPPKAPTVALW